MFFFGNEIPISLPSICRWLEEVRRFIPSRCFQTISKIFCSTWKSSQRGHNKNSWNYHLHSFKLTNRWLEESTSLRGRYHLKWWIFPAGGLCYLIQECSIMLDLRSILELVRLYLHGYLYLNCQLIKIVLLREMWTNSQVFCSSILGVIFWQGFPVSIKNHQFRVAHRTVAGWNLLRRWFYTPEKTNSSPLKLDGCKMYTPTAD